MPNLLIATDLHISVEEKNYSFAVLDEIIENALSYDALLLLGDTFNTFEDVKALKDDFNRRIEYYKKPVYILKGNHELLKSNNIKLSNLQFPNNVNIIEDIDVFDIDETIIVAVAYNEEYNINDSIINEIKKLDNIIFIGHGIVEGTLWSLESGEDKASIPIELIKKINPKLAIIGHIHKNMELNINNINIIYPGSARVWRRSKSEMGIRKCLGINVSNGIITKKYINLKSAGEYRVYEVSIDSIESLLDREAINWSIEDIIDISVYGIIEDENDFSKKIKDIINKYKKYIRAINIKTDKLFLLENAKNENIIKEFLDVINNYNINDEEKDILELAKKIGIEKIYSALQSKKNI